MVSHNDTNVNFRFIEPVKKNGPIFKAVDLPRASKRSRSKRAVDASCDTQITPSCLQQLYNIPTTPAKDASNKLAVTGRYGNNAHYKWLQVSYVSPTILPRLLMTWTNLVV